MSTLLLTFYDFSLDITPVTSKNLWPSGKVHQKSKMLINTLFAKLSRKNHVVTEKFSEWRVLGGKYRCLKSVQLNYKYVYHVQKSDIKSRAK